MLSLNVELNIVPFVRRKLTVNSLWTLFLCQLFISSSCQSSHWSMPSVKITIIRLPSQTSHNTDPMFNWRSGIQEVQTPAQLWKRNKPCFPSCIALALTLSWNCKPASAVIRVPLIVQPTPTVNIIREKAETAWSASLFDSVLIHYILRCVMV